MHNLEDQEDPCLEGAALVCRKERAELKRKSLDLLLRLRSNPHLKSEGLDCDTKCMNDL